MTQNAVLIWKNNDESPQRRRKDFRFIFEEKKTMFCQSLRVSY